MRRSLSVCIASLQVINIVWINLSGNTWQIPTIVVKGFHHLNDKQCGCEVWNGIVLNHTKLQHRFGIHMGDDWQ